MPSSKCVLFWFFSIHLLKKHTLNAEITLLYQFHAQKALLTVSKICNIIFGIENNPPWNFSENSDDLVQPSVPESGHWKPLKRNWANNVISITFCKSMTQILAKYPRYDTFFQREREIYADKDICKLWFSLCFDYCCPKWQCLNPNHPFGRKLLQSVATCHNFKLDPANFSTAYFVPWSSNY